MYYVSLLRKLAYGRAVTAPLALRLHHHLSLFVPAAHHGAGAADRRAQDCCLVRHNERYNQAARFWAKIFAINFLIGVVTGIPMEFQFGTNWAQFARTTGGVIGQPLAMEGVFSFFLESAFLGLFLFGEKRLSPWAHWGSAFLVFVGSWISGFFIIVTNAWMQHPVAYRVLPNGSFEITSFWGLLTNPWALIQYSHNMSGAVITGAFVMCSVGAFYLLENRFTEHGQDFRSRRSDRRSRSPA